MSEMAKNIRKRLADLKSGKNTLTVDHAYKGQADMSGAPNKNDLVMRVPSPKAKPAKNPREKRVPSRTRFADELGYTFLVGECPDGVRIGRATGPVSKETARALGEYLIALADRSGK